MNGTGIWFVRHGQTTLNKERRYQSWSDSPLTDRGQRQVIALAHRLHDIPFDVALVGPTLRTRTTADMLLSERIPIVPQIEDPAWAEINHGHWEGLTYQEVAALFPNEACARFTTGAGARPTGGESLAEAARRVGDAWNELLHQQAGRRVLVVTSATPIQLILCAVLGMPPSSYWHWRIDTGSLTAIHITEAGPIVQAVNEAPLKEHSEF